MKNYDRCDVDLVSAAQRKLEKNGGLKVCLFLEK